MRCHTFTCTHGDAEWLFPYTEKYFWSLILTQNVFSGHRKDTECPLGLTFLVNFFQIMTFLVSRLEMNFKKLKKYHLWYRTFLYYIIQKICFGVLGWNEEVWPHMVGICLLSTTCPSCLFKLCSLVLYVFRNSKKCNFYLNEL